MSKGKEKRSIYSAIELGLSDVAAPQISLMGVTFEFNPVTGAPTVALDAPRLFWGGGRGLEYLWTRMTQWEHTKLIDYRLDSARDAYKKARSWLQLGDPPTVVAPYQILFDYRANPSRGWGTVECTGDYEFPEVLRNHREAMIHQLRKKGRLYGDSRCPRVSKFDVKEDGKIVYRVENAFYYDQVGTNLSLDYKGAFPVPGSMEIATTVRGWDVLNAGVARGELPALEQSRLANTLGVAVAVTAVNKRGNISLLRRLRRKKLAVYGNMWGVPLSFAVKLEGEKLETGSSTPLASLLSLNTEILREMGMHRDDFADPTPLAFCRDLGRGGKPQLFFEMRAKVPFEEIVKRMTDNSERLKQFKSWNWLRLRLGASLEASRYRASPELAAAIALLMPE